MKIINRHIFKEVFFNIFWILVALLLLFSILDIVQEVDYMGHGKYDLSNILVFVLARIPSHAYELMPIAILIGAIVTLGYFVRYSELIIVRTSGVSIWRIGKILLCASAIYAVLMMVVGETIAPASEKIARKIKLQATDSVVVQELKTGFWIKSGKSFVNSEEILSNATLARLHIYQFDENSELKALWDAGNAVFTSGVWQLNEVKQYRFVNGDIIPHYYNSVQWADLVHPEFINMVMLSPEKMSVRQLYLYINHLSLNHQKTTRYQVALWTKIFYPITCITMIILALPLGLSQHRSHGMGIKIIAGILMGVLYQLISKVFLNLGALNDWYSFFSALATTLLFLMLAIFLLVWRENFHGHF